MGVLKRIFRGPITRMADEAARAYAMGATSFAPDYSYPNAIPKLWDRMNAAVEAEGWYLAHWTVETGVPYDAARPVFYRR